MSNVNEHLELAYRCAIESMVLLENDGTLPLKNVDRIALFGPGARYTLYGGGGSGSVNSLHPISIYEGLLDAGYQVTSQNWLERFSGLFRKAEEQVLSKLQRALFTFNVNKIGQAVMDEVTLPELNVTQTHIESSPGDAAIYVLTRQSGEGRDRTLTPGSYYLTEGEKDSIQRLSKAYNKFILVINSGAPVDMEFMKDMNHVNAIIFMGQPGCMAGKALADILNGTANPCGKLTDSWPISYKDIYHGKHFGNISGNLKQTHYKERGLVGDRYFDSQNVPVRYSFGYGLSYTRFSIDRPDISIEKSKVTVSVTVKNTGSAPGKEVVQVYAGKAFSAGMGEPRVLVGFAKTELLPRGGRETLNIEFDTKDLATFREKEGRFRVDAGEYAIYVGNSLDNTAKPIPIYIPEESFLSRIRKPTPSTSRRTLQIIDSVEKVVSQISDEDKIALCVGTGMLDNKMPSPAQGSVGHTAYHLAHLGVNNLEMADGPSGLRLQTRYGIYPDGKRKMITPQMNALNYLPGYIKRFIFADPNKCEIVEQPTTAFPVGTSMAQTWNLNLLEEMGRAISEEMTDFNVAFWLAPAVNIHRNPLCGRNFEYYSEDPLLAGKCAAAVIRGVQSIPGHISVIKHFCCNNQEDNRMASNSVVDICTLRDIYLRVFEIAIREGKPKGVMTSYNRINGIHAAANEFLILQVLRDEWYYDGIVMTDWNSSMVTKAHDSIKAGVDLIMPGSKRDIKDITKAIKKKTLDTENIEVSCRRVLRAYFDYTLG
ncbi:MAG: glycoside hydrolase family 3 C-terminal domain-containing protein [Lachnospiraceae bacterium]|nr:glycoside hydrolase family 3 C-terminal domain-containing protein [Lachnospiraceae bacterium]